MYIARAKALVEPIVQEQCDLICLQEYWFHEKFESIFQKALGPHYWNFTLKRPGRKEDGLAIFVSKKRFHVHDVVHVNFDHAGGRVNLCMHLSLNESGYASEPFQQTTVSKAHSFMLSNCHLTFPHNDFNRVLRMQQISAALRCIRGYKEKNGLLNVPSILCGDMNDQGDAVHERVLQDGFESAFHKVHGREAGITHCNHNKDEVGVDFIFAQNPANARGISLHPTSCHLYPKVLDDSASLKRPTFNNWVDTRTPSTQCTESLIEYWSFVSDHRPLIAELMVEKHFS